MWGDEGMSLKTGGFTCCQKEASSVKQADLMSLFKKVSKNACTAAVVISPDPVSPTAWTLPALKTPKIAEDKPDDPEAANLGDIHVEYSSD